MTEKQKNALWRVAGAARRVYDGLNARIDAAVAEGGHSVPVFNGLADLHDAFGALANASKEASS